MTILFSGILNASLSQPLLNTNTPFEVAVFAKSFHENSIDYFIAADASADIELSGKVKLKIAPLIDQLRKRQSKLRSDKHFLRQMFYSVHRKVLKDYSSHALFTETIMKGNYDCVTGTIVYGILLNELGYEFSIRELDYHLYLEVKTADGIVLMESTDPMYGFDFSPSKMRINGINGKTDQPVYEFSSVSDNRVGLKELAGLQYYNLAIKHYNNQDYSKAHASITKALNLYNSSRIKEVRDLIVLLNGESVALAND